MIYSEIKYAFLLGMAKISTEQDSWGVFLFGEGIETILYLIFYLEKGQR